MTGTAVVALKASVVVDAELARTSSGKAALIDVCSMVSTAIDIVQEGFLPTFARDTAVSCVVP